MYQCIYNEEEQTLQIKIGAGGTLFVGLVIAFIIVAGIALLCIKKTVGSILFVAFLILPTVIFMIWLLRREEKTYLLLTKEGICSVEPKRQQYLRWDECNFIGIYHFGVAHSSPGLIISKHVPERNEKGKIPKSYPWPKEETFDLTDIWCYLSEEDQQKILSFCGGMKG